MDVCIYIHVHVSKIIHIHINIQTRISSQLYIHIIIPTLIHIFIHTHKSTCIHIFIQVNHSSGDSPVEKVKAYPASVDVYCHDCTTFQNNSIVSKAGYVTSVTQNASQITTAFYRWWKVYTHKHE